MTAVIDMMDSVCNHSDVLLQRREGQGDKDFNSVRLAYAIRDPSCDARHGICGFDLCDNPDEASHGKTSG